jgi:TRAP-type C4-dicarboxylate transport system substrate-binding protein
MAIASTRRALLAAILLLVPASQALAQQTWKIGTVVAPPSALGVIVDDLAKEITEATQGAIKAERFQQPNEQEIAQNVIRGRYEMAYISSTGLAPAIPEMGVMNIPFLWTNAAERDFVTDKFVLPLIAQILESKGLVLVRAGEAGWTSIFCKTPCTTPDKLKGMKVRVSPTAGDKMMFERLGSNGVTMTLADFYPALEQGVVNGGTLTFSFYLIGPAATSAPHYVFTQHAHQPAYLVANKAAWSKVTAEQRAAIDKALLTTDAMRARVLADEKPKKDLHRSKGGFVHDLTTEQRAEWAKVIVPGHDSLVASYGGRAKELYDLIQKGKAEFKARQN